jgi:hypothetical protein
MSDGSQQGSTELRELMGRVLQSDASEEFRDFMVRRIALSDMAPNADDAVLDGVDASPDGGAAMAEAHLEGLPEEEREDILERAAMETGRRLHSAASALIEAVHAARMDVAISPEMVAIAAITELGDSSGRPLA